MKMLYNRNNLPKHEVLHSPDGFNWGYGGSGPAELARCLLLEVTGDGDRVDCCYQDFKWEFVSNWNDDWEMYAHEIHEWFNTYCATHNLNA